MKKRIFISFDFEDDKHYRYLLSAWNQHPGIDLDFHDHTPLEIDSIRINRVKAALTLKIKQADKVLIVAGRNVNKKHLSHRTIRFINWINFEVAQAIVNKKELIVVKTNPADDIPSIIDLAFEKNMDVKGIVIESFDRNAITNAILK